ncbi:NAD(P)-binding protein [Lophiostoma macrostomum CBS 122681]|uniref:NAD(P)-binding protein n=1 Tax=Lophiostoma macrostomum CBS 122681 TaxID=1314788 RepID=A0A6A6SQD4_9PLEO|nr:NAD(P)-binding protein [Lophiostoma macrostomum CBS 122681]
MGLSSQLSVLVTGCSAGGIGSALAFSFASRGHLVFATARNTSKIDPQLATLSNVEVLELDTTSTESIAAAAEVVGKRTGGGLGVLVNNAGMGFVNPFLDVDLDAARKMFEVNFWGALMCIQGFKNLLVKAKGTIVNNSSMAFAAPCPYLSLYCASKAALSHLDAVIALELKPLNVRVISLITGKVASEFYTNNPKHTLPTDSLYHAVSEDVQDAILGKGPYSGGTEVQKFADDVVKQVLKQGTKGKLWWGEGTGLVKFATGWLPAWVLQGFLYKTAGLGKVEKGGKA